MTLYSCLNQISFTIVQGVETYPGQSHEENCKVEDNAHMQWLTGNNT